MNFGMAFKMAISSIFSSKVRSFLTMLGIIIGVGAVIILVNIVNAASLTMREQLEEMGTNLISVTITNSSRRTTRYVEVEEIQKLADENPDLIEFFTPLVSSTVTVKYGSENLSTSLKGCNKNYETIRNHHITEGRFISDYDVENRSNIAVIGGYVRSELFGNNEALNQQIKINGVTYTVVGVLENKSTNVSEGSDDDVIILPYTNASRLIKNAYISSFAVQGADSDRMDEATDVIENFLYKKFQNDDMYMVFNQAELMDTIDDALSVMALLMAGIAGISLVVGGIGIMNIMLVTVTERTREIGIRKSIGAKTRSILTQFLIESAVLSCIGGIIGIVLGVVGSYFTCIAMDMSVVPISKQLTVIIGSFAFSAALGVFFGLYPARKAAKLNPIDALRFE